MPSSFSVSRTLTPPSTSMRNMKPRCTLPTSFVSSFITPTGSSESARSTSTSSSTSRRRPRMSVSSRSASSTGFMCPPTPMESKPCSRFSPPFLSRRSTSTSSPRVSTT